MKKTDTNKLYRKLMVRTALIVVLVVCMAVTTYAYINSILRVADNTFVTGLVDINLIGNDAGGSLVTFRDANGEPIKLIEPGGTYVATFKVENNSTDPTGKVHYRLYFDGIEGNYLATILEVDIIMNGSTVKTGKMSDFGRDAKPFSFLNNGETEDFTMIMRYPSAEGNEGQGLKLDNFTLIAEAVQNVNNEDGAFNDEALDSNKPTE